jgi:hypothetical protein
MTGLSMRSRRARGMLGNDPRSYRNAQAMSGTNLWLTGVMKVDSNGQLALNYSTDDGFDSASATELKCKAGTGIQIDSNGIALKFDGDRGLDVDGNGLFVDLDPLKGLQFGAAGDIECKVGDKMLFDGSGNINLDPSTVTPNELGALTTDWDAGNFEIRARTFESDVTTGTAPFVVASTTVVSNLNADQLDGNEAAAFSLTSHTHALGDLSDVTDGAGSNRILFRDSLTWTSKAAIDTRTGTNAEEIVMTNTNGYIDGSFVNKGSFLESDGGDGIQVDVDSVAGLGDPLGGGLGVMLEASNPTLQFSSGRLAVKMGSGLVTSASGVTFDSDISISDSIHIGAGSADTGVYFHVKEANATSPTWSSNTTAVFENDGDCRVQVHCSNTGAAIIGFSGSTEDYCKITGDIQNSRFMLHINSQIGFRLNSSAEPFFDNGRIQSGGADARIQSSGELTAASSSRRYKKNITPLDFDWRKILLLPEPRSFNYRSEKPDDRPFATKGRNFGYIAEEVDKVLPELVSYEDLDFDPEADPSITRTPRWAPSAVSYGQITPLLVEGLKDLVRRMKVVEAAIGV